MKTLNVIITNKVAVYSQRGGEIVCGNDDYQIKFTFDTEWDAFNAKTARFKWNGAFYDVPFTGNTVTVPRLINTKKLEVGVYAGDVMHTSTGAIIKCVPSSLCGTTVQAPGSDAPYYAMAKAEADRAEKAAAEAAMQLMSEVYETVEPINLFDKNNTANRNGYIIQNSSYLALNGFTVTHPIEAKNGAYTFHTNAGQLGGNALLVVPCNSSGEILAKATIATDNGDKTATITIDENWGATHFAVNVYNKELDSFMVVKGDTMPSEYSSYFTPYKVLKKEMIPSELTINSPLCGKKIALNGDSICYGAGSTGGYGKIIADAYEMTLQNIAVSGGTIAAETYTSDGASPRHWICRTIANMDADADYAIIEGGVNDASIKPPLGTITEGLKATLDDTTFYGAFESMLKQLTLRFAGKKIGYIIVHQMHEDFSPVKPDNYYWAAKKCCEKWGVPFLDLSIACPPFGLIFPSNTEMYPLREAYTANADGWHPNEEGYKTYYVPKIVKWLESL